MPTLPLFLNIECSKFISNTDLDNSLRLSLRINFITACLGFSPLLITSFTALIIGSSTLYFFCNFIAAGIALMPSTTMPTSFIASSVFFPCPIR